MNVYALQIKINKKKLFKEKQPINKCKSELIYLVH